MRLVQSAVVALALAVLGAELLIVPFELHYVDNITYWLGYGFVWSMARFREIGGIAIRWDIVSFEVCITTTLAFVAYAIAPRRLRHAF